MQWSVGRGPSNSVKRLQSKHKGPSNVSSLNLLVYSILLTGSALVERRVRFLTKLAAPPSPSAADLPVTPPDSPAIFHFTLPSPGLESPLEHFEALLDHPELFENTKRVEQVDFRLPRQGQAEVTRYSHSSGPAMNNTSSLPSLDQISQRLNKGSVTSSTNAAPCPGHGSKGNSRLPSFLHSCSPSVTVTPEATPVANNQPPKRSRPVLPVLSLRTATKSVGLAIRTPTPIATSGPAFPAFPPSPKSPQHVKLQITTTVSSHTRSNSSPTEFSEKNISQLISEQPGVVTRPTDSTVTDVHPAPSRRALVTKDMFHKLSRRTPCLPGAAACGIKARDDILLAPTSSDPDGKVRRRISAPAELPESQRRAYHPVLEKAGGF